MIHAADIFTFMCAHPVYTHQHRIDQDFICCMNVFHECFSSNSSSGNTWSFQLLIIIKMLYLTRSVITAKTQYQNTDACKGSQRCDHPSLAFLQLFVIFSSGAEEAKCVWLSQRGCEGGCVKARLSLKTKSMKELLLLLIFLPLVLLVLVPELHPHTRFTV